MRLVADSNVLFTHFWKSSVFMDIVNQDVTLYSPEYALEEIEKHRQEIIKKTGLDRVEFNVLRKNLELKISFINEREYAQSFKPALESIENLPKPQQTELCEDLDFIALSIKMRCPLWSNDKLLKKQTTVTVLNTHELLLLMGEKY